MPSTNLPRGLHPQSVTPGWSQLRSNRTSHPASGTLSQIAVTAESATARSLASPAPRNHSGSPSICKCNARCFLRGRTTNRLSPRNPVKPNREAKPGRCKSPSTTSTLRPECFASVRARFPVTNVLPSPTTLLVTCNDFRFSFVSQVFQPCRQGAEFFSGQTFWIDVSHQARRRRNMNRRCGGSF